MYQGALFCLFTMVFTFYSLVQCCPHVCKCSSIKASSDKPDSGLRVICTPQTGFATWHDLQSFPLPNSTVFLMLQSGMLTTVPAFSFVDLHGLKKLDLSKNNISELHDGAFFNLTSLEKLDLSYNRLAKLSSTVFRSLQSLIRLNLQGNFLSRLDEDHVASLSSLKFLDISNNPLICDCHLKWLNEWSQSNRIRLPPKTSCQFPKELQGISFLRVTKKDLHCQWPLQLPVFELNPDVDQLVFEGDSFSLNCYVSNIESDINVTWALNGKSLKSGGVFVNVSSSLTSDGSVISSSVHIQKLQVFHSGSWQCLVNSSRGNNSQAVQLMVIANNGTLCPRIVSVDNKGQHVWPETPAGITVEMECNGKKTGRNQGHRAYHTCTREGVWKNLNTEKCPYMSEVTNVLEHFSKINITFGHANVLDTARLLRNYTNDYKLFRDKMDIVFVSRTLQNYVTAVPYHHELAEIIVDIINTLLYLDRNLLRAAQIEDQSCSRLVWILEQLPELLMDIPLNRIQENIAVEEFFVRAEGFTGIRCSSFMKNNNVYNSVMSWANSKIAQDEKVLNCNIANSSDGPVEMTHGVEASLQLPATIFQQAWSLHVNRPVHKLQFVIYRNSLLFPRSAMQSHMQDITSSVISAKIAHFDVRNLTEPVVVSLRTAAYTTDIKPVWWDAEALGGKGAWSEDGCFILKVHRNVVTFACNKLASFGLLQNVDALVSQYTYETAQFRFCHPAVYVGSAICIFFLMTAFSLYCITYRTMKLPGKTKHSVMNTFFAMVLLCIAFTFGVLQTDIISVCQAFGFILHYLTLCTLLWMLVSSSNLYKSVRKLDQLSVSSSESISEHPLPPKPMLRFYLVGWGIPSIIVGISAAVNIRNYGGNKLCFLSFNPCLGALYCPAILLLIVLCCLYLLIYQKLREKDLFNKNCGERLSSVTNNAVTSTVVDSANIKTPECSESNDMLSDELLLQGHSTLLVLFLIAWITGAAYAARLFEGYVPYDELISSLLYCITSSLLGLYCFLFFCYCHHVKFSCVFVALCSLCKNQKNNERSKTECVPMMTIGDMADMSVADCGTVIGRTCEPGTVSAFDSSSLPATSAFTNSSDNSLNTVKVFYDPWQSVVARRFFEKNRRQQQLQQLRKSSLTNATQSANVKSSNTSDSSHAVSDCKSEPSNAFHSTKPSLAKDPLRKISHTSKISHLHSQKFSPSESLKCRCLRKDICPMVSSDDSHLQSSGFLPNFCSDISTDIFPVRKKQPKRIKKNRRKCDSSCYIQKVKKPAQYSSFSAEDLKNDCQCCKCQSACQALSGNDVCMACRSSASVSAHSYNQKKGS